MQTTKQRAHKRVLQWVSAGLALAMVAGCGTAGQSTGGNGSVGASQHNATGTAQTKGTASVAYAGSLQLANEQTVGPAFTKATGLRYQGRGEGAYAIAQLIHSGEITPNVFMSIGTGPIGVISPEFATWAVGFASSPLVIAYSPQSPFASQLKAIAKGQEPLSKLFQLMAKPNFHLGRTDPNTDPQGQSFVFMMHLAEQTLHLPKGTADHILGGTDNPKQIFDEEAILSRLQAGQLDASSAYLPEAIERHLPYIALPSSINLGDPADAHRYASQQLTLHNGKTVHGAPIEVYISALQGTPGTSAGQAFVSYVLSPAGRKLYQQQGYTLNAPIVYGNRSNIPKTIRSELGQVK